MTYVPVKERKRGQWEPKEYYKNRAKIMKECYLRGHNPKEIVGYFRVGLSAFYHFLSVHKLKGIKNVIAYRKMLEQDAKLKSII